MTDTTNTGGSASPAASGTTQPPAGGVVQGAPAGADAGAAAPDPKAAQIALAFDKGDAAIGGAKKSEPDPKVAAAKAPEAQKPEPDIEIKWPDGVKASDAQIAEAKATAKELGLNAEQASKAVAWDLKRQTAAADALVAEHVKAEKAKDEKWRTEIKADPKMGGEHLPKTLTNVNRAVGWFEKITGNTALKDVVDEYGLGNHPTLVRLLSSVGAALAEDSSGVAGGTGAGVPVSDDAAWQQFYNNKTQGAG